MISNSRSKPIMVMKLAKPTGTTANTTILYKSKNRAVFGEPNLWLVLDVTKLWMVYAIVKMQLIKIQM